MKRDEEIRALRAALVEATERLEWLRAFNAAHADCLASRVPGAEADERRWRERLAAALKTTEKNRQGTR